MSSMSVLSRLGVGTIRERRPRKSVPGACGFPSCGFQLFLVFEVVSKSKSCHPRSTKLAVRDHLVKGESIDSAKELGVVWLQ